MSKYFRYEINNEVEDDFDKFWNVSYSSDDNLIRFCFKFENREEKSSNLTIISNFINFGRFFCFN